MYCKTHSKDFKRLKNMLNSFKKYNRDKVLLYISVPQLELDLFMPLKDENIEIMTDESYAEKYFATNTRYGFGISYVNQEICKLCFWEAGFCENYLCIDSDVTFIRDFYISDFMRDEKTPYSVLVMDKDLSVEKRYQSFWSERQECIIKIFEMVGLNDNRYRTCHGMQCLNKVVLKSLKEDYMQPKGLAYKDLIDIAPLEFTWYNAWLQKSKVIDIVEVEPFFKTFHNNFEYIYSKLQLIETQDLARAYVGIILNSNWAEQINYEKPNLMYKIFYKIISKLLIKNNF